MPDNSQSLISQFRRAAFKALLQDFSRKVDAISNEQSANQISWNEAITRIGVLIEEFRVEVKKLGFSRSDFDLESHSSFYPSDFN